MWPLLGSSIFGRAPRRHDSKLSSKKLQQERFQAIRDEFSARSAALREEYAAKLSAIEDLEASVDDAIATTAKKTAEYKLQRQGLSREAK